MYRRFAPILLCLLFLFGCSSSHHAEQTTIPTQTYETEEPQVTTTASTQPVSFDPYAIIETMSVESMVGQLFLGSCPGKSSAIQDITTYQPGGFVLFGSDFENETPQSLQKTLEEYQAASDIPMLLAVDEEGGSVVRVTRYPQFRNEPFPSPRSLYAQGGKESVLSAEAEKCDLLRSMGINVNLGPVCDVTTNQNSFMYSRSLGLSPQSTGSMIASMVHTMSSKGIGSVLKHFPGYGDNADTHIGSALDSRSLQQLVGNDLVPFSCGIAAGCDAIMVSHTVIAAMDDTLPASLSPNVHRYIREQMHFDGVLITDDLIMDAISGTYGDGEAAVLAILAGNDMLCTGAFQKQYPAVLDAVNSGRIQMDTLRKSVARILIWKRDLGLIS